ncbi:hypothetical protein [Labedaea rhizosphaerae]|uniref:hypothetical protein n=1 Tax=Labedaea rhizosphaerae TaxID=598644 RepID=UPI001060B883|nr:hypothetical protein [Labedaea rhizosphaerae]
MSESVADFELKTYRAAWESLYSIKAAWMNPYSSSRPLERDKLLQARIAGDAGLLTVPTIFTNNPEEYSLFVASLQGDDVAVKAPISWHSDVVGSETPYGTYTRRLAQADALRLSSRVARSPVLVQPYVEKSYELRITVVGERIFACRIDSQKSPRAKVDWRHYDTASVPHDAVQIDTGVERALFEFMHRAGLVFAAIDMIVEPNGDHRFLEANPSGQFSWIEALTGLTITAGIVDWLSGA